MSTPPRSHLDTSHLSAGLQARTARGGVVTIAGRAGRVLVEGVLIVVLARLLPPSDFGLVGMALTVTRFVQLFKDLGLNMATVQRDEISQAQVSALFWINAGAGLILTVLVVAASPLIALFYEQPALTAITMWFALGVAFAGVSAQHLALLRRQMRFGALAIVELVGALLGLAGAVTLALMGFGYWALVANAVLAAAGSAVASWLLCNWRPSALGRLRDVRELLRFGGQLTGVNVFNYLARNLDDILIGKLLGPHALGLYQRAYELIFLPVAQICVPIGHVALGALSRLQNDAARYRESFGKIFSVLLLINVPFGAWLVAVADLALPLLLGPEWAESARIFVFLGLVLAVQPVGHATSWLMITQGRTGELLKWSLISNITTAAVFVVSIRWGVEAVALSYALGGLFFRMPGGIWFATRSGPVGWAEVYGPIVVFFCSAAAVLGAVTVFRHFAALPPVATLVLSLPVAAIAGTLCLAPFRTGRQALGSAFRTLSAWRRNMVASDHSG
jgi:O-antigen/teichoic acid export membrane protein